MNDALKEKDPLIIEAINRLKQELGDDAFDVVDYWDADLYAIGIALPQNHRVLVYISTYNIPVGKYHIQLELPSQDGEIDSYKDVGNRDSLEFEELTKHISDHFERGRTYLKGN